MVCHLFGRESIYIHGVWIGAVSLSWGVSLDWGVSSTLSSYDFLDSKPLIVESASVTVPLVDCGGDGLECIDLFKEFGFQSFHEIFYECGVIRDLGLLG